MFLLNVGYHFKFNDAIKPDGAIVLASSMPSHQLLRRKMKGIFKEHLLFDPQLYLCGLDSSRALDTCLKLASYPWFIVPDLQTYDSGIQNQAQWREANSGAVENLYAPRKDCALH